MPSRDRAAFCPATWKVPDKLTQLLIPYARRAESAMRRWLVEPGTPLALARALRYSALDGGKRFRPALVYMSAQAVGGDPDAELTARSAAAVEMVHCYSLVHDDLPAMDDDSLRRGRPTAHVRFGEAMAILAGDALLTRAFALLAEAGDGLSPRLAAELARGAGPAGMIAGQVADMKLCPVPAGAAGVRYIHLRKTAALIRAAARMGGVCGCGSEDQVEALGLYGEALGLAFQLVDDVLDATGDAAQLGKTPGKDARDGKRTGISQAGIPAARRRVAALTAGAVGALNGLGEPAEPLRSLAGLLGARTR